VQITLLAQWPDYYGERSAADVEMDFRECMNTERLPIGLVAWDGQAPVGFIALRERAMTQLPDYSPGLGAFYVAPLHRSRGIGSSLVRRGMHLPQDPGRSSRGQDGKIWAPSPIGARRWRSTGGGPMNIPGQTRTKS